MITDFEAGLVHRFRRDVSNVTAEAQALVDSKNVEILRLRRENAFLRARIAEFEAERRGRLDALVALRRKAMQ